MADLRDFTKKNTVFVGTDGIRLPSGNNAQRVASANVDATLRYNTDIGGMEVYSPNGWTPLAAPPSISTVSPATFSGESGTSFEIQGTNINPDAQVYFVTSNGATLLAATITYFGSSQIRATTPRNISVAEEPLSIRLVQQSGTVTKLNCIDAGGHPDWVTTAGTLGSIFGANTVNVYVTATDPENTAVTYQLSTGSLPGGLNFTTSNGLIQGVATSVLANTTYNFTIRATDTVNNNTDRSFSYTVLNRAPVINTAAGNLGTVYSGNATSTSISAYDPDGGSLTYAVASGSLPTNSSLGTANGVIQGTPIVVTTNTTYTFSISATDEGSLSASNTYTYTVLNRPPLWNTDATLTSYSAETFTPITVNAYDPDGGSVTYALTSGSVPSGLTFVSANATITGSATEVTDNTTSTFTVTATDPGSDANARTFSLTITPIIDAQFSNTILLLKNSGNTVIQDLSVSGLPLTSVGNTSASNFGPFNTSWSTYFGTYATNSYLTYVPGTSVAFGTGDFTIECFAYWDSDPGSTANPYIIDTRGGGGSWAFSWNWTGGSNGSVLAWTKADGNYHQASTQMPLRQWNHCAYVRSGTTGTIYLNGVSILSFTDSTNYSASISLAHLGKRYSGDQANPGYQSNLRIVKGTAVYLSAFTPPTSKLTAITNTVLLTHQTGSFKDNSTANSGTGFTITTSGLPKAVGFSPFEETDTITGSIYFDGTGDYVSNLPSDLLDFGSSEEFSIEFFAYFNNVPNSFGMLGLNAGIQQGYCIVYDVGGGHYLLSGKTDEIGSASLLRTQSAGTLYPYKWHHICFARRSGVMSIYLDGVRVATRSSDTTTYASGAATVGYAGQGSATAMNGFMSNLRILTGASAYDTSQTTLTVPTSPVSNISGTRLLTFQNRLPHNNHGFQDHSLNKHIVTRYGNTTQGTFTPFSADPGKWSNYFLNASSQGLSIADNSNLRLGSGDFTVECYFYIAGNSSLDGGSQARACLIGKIQADPPLWGLNIDAAGATTGTGLVFNFLGTQITYTGTITQGVWHHVAAVRSGSSTGNIKIYLNGTSVASGTSTSTDTNTGAVTIGWWDYPASQYKFYFNGYISNARIVKGTAVYTSNFTPSTTPLTAISGTQLLTCQSNYFLDNSTNNFTITRSGTPSVQSFSPFTSNATYSVANTGGSMYNSAVPDGLKMINPSTQFGTSGNYTVSMWYYPTGQTGDYNPLWIFSDSTSNDNPMAGLFFNSGYSLFWLNNGAGGNGFNANMGITIVPFQWNHIVVTRTSGTTRCWTNGTLRVDGWSADSMNADKRVLYIGTGRTNADTTPGYTSGFQFLNGISLYTTATNFTPPTLPPTRIANTAALLNFTDAAIVDYTGKNNVQTVGDAKANNSTYKFSPGSMYFDGTGDYLVLPANKIYDFGTGDFTIECWVRLITINSAKMLVTSNYNAGTGAGGWALIHRADTSSLSLSVNSNVTYTKSWSPTAGIWYHVSVSRSGTNLRFFIDGTQIGTTSTSSDNVTGSSTVIVAGNSTSNLPIDANINDLRITKSARYITNFTPPTRSFPNR